jgi:hypothetical protein
MTMVQQQDDDEIQPIQFPATSETTNGMDVNDYLDDMKEIKERSIELGKLSPEEIDKIYTGLYNKGIIKCKEGMVKRKKKVDGKIALESREDLEKKTKGKILDKYDDLVSKKIIFKSWTKDKIIDAIAKQGSSGKEITVETVDFSRLNKRNKIDRIISTELGFKYIPINLPKKVLKVMEKDWEESSSKDFEIFRMLCLKKSDLEKEKPAPVMITSLRVDGQAGAGSVKPDYGLCEKEFGNKVIGIGGVHTHPSFMDKPLESLGDVITFSVSEKESIACTITKWGVMCMFRKKEPALIYDIPKVTKTGKPRYNKNGILMYEFKSDVVDWDRAREYATAGTADSVFISALGHLDLGNLVRVPWFQPDNKPSRSIGTVEAPSDWGKEQSELQDVNDLYCETFLDYQGKTDGKIRTVCNNGDDDEHFYVESRFNPVLLMFNSEKGFPTNIYYDKNTGNKVETKVGLSEDTSRYWNVRLPDRPGAIRTSVDAKFAAIGVDKETPMQVIRSASFKINGKVQCEYLLETSTGKPASILCKKKSKVSPSRTCIMI